MKNKSIKKGKPLQEQPEVEILEKEIEDMIDREKTKSRIVSKLLNQTTTSIVKSNNWTVNIY